MVVDVLENGSTTQWRKLRKYILDRDAHTCVYCGNDANHVDHVIPRSRGGTDEPDNLVASCAQCNIKKSNTFFLSPADTPAYSCLALSPKMDKSGKMSQIVRIEGDAIFRRSDGS